MSREVCQLEEGYILVPIGIPTICWTLAAKNPRKYSPPETQASWWCHLQSTSFWSRSHQTNYFSMSLLKIETKTHQFCFELKHHGILNEKRLNLRWLLINTAKNRNGISPDQFHQAMQRHVEHNGFLNKKKVYKIKRLWWNFRKIPISV